MYRVPDVWIQLVPLNDERTMDSDLFHSIKAADADLSALGLHVRCNHFENWSWSAGQSAEWPRIPDGQGLRWKFAVVGVCVSASAVQHALKLPNGSEILEKAVIALMRHEGITIHALEQGATIRIASPDHFSRWMRVLGEKGVGVARQNICAWPKSEG